ncbi:MAG: putative heme transporter [Mycobacterium sp.]|nr:putative heme transporter [Mycobacterium sp.]
MASAGCGYATGMPAPEDDAVPPLVRKASAWSWRLLLIFAAVVTFLWMFKALELIIVPVALALMFSALLVPGVDWLDRKGVPRGLAVFLLLLLGLALVGGILTFVVSQFIEGLPDLVTQVKASIQKATNWLSTGPAHLNREQIDNVGKTAIDAISRNQDRLTTGALSTASTITEILTGAFVVLFTLIFFLYGGRNIHEFVTRIFPVGVREKVREAGRAGFGSLIGYVRATFLVALVDAVGIGTGLAIMAVPLALPLASLVFLGAFIPLVGAVLTGFIAVVVALLTKGFVYALITLGLIVAVQQLEAHVLQPVVMGRAVSIHPLAVVLGISTGAVLAGIVGALLAVPAIAFLNSAIRVLLDEDVGAPGESPDGEESVGITAQADDVRTTASKPDE